MTADVEQALEAFLTAQLSLVFDPVPAINAGASKKIIEPTKPLVVIAVRTCPRLAGNVYTAHVFFIIETPVPADYTVANHSALVKAVEYALNPLVDTDHDAVAVAAIKQAKVTALLDVAKCVDCGSWVDGPDDGHTKESWKTAIQVKQGLERV